MTIFPDGSALDNWRGVGSFTMNKPPWADCIPALYGGLGKHYEEDVLKVARFVAASTVGQLVLAEISSRVLVTPYYPKTSCEVNASVSVNASVIEFTPALYWRGTNRPAPCSCCPRPPSRADSALLHELVHVVRRRNGYLPGPSVGRWYFSEEEVITVLIQNYYNQQRGLPPRRSHRNHAPLGVTDRIWLGQSPDGHRTYHDFVAKLLREHERLALGLAATNVPFNPIALVAGSEGLGPTVSASAP